MRNGKNYKHNFNFSFLKCPINFRSAFLIILFLFIIIISVSSYDLMQLNGHWWRRITIGEALSFVQGFLLGQHQIAMILLEYGVINSQEEYDLCDLLEDKLLEAIKGGDTR